MKSSLYIENTKDSIAQTPERTSSNTKTIAPYIFSLANSIIVPAIAINKTITKNTRANTPKIPLIVIYTPP